MNSNRNLYTRGIKLYQKGGIPALGQAVKRRYQGIRSNLILSWAFNALTKELIARRINPKQPPILVISLPRSGSSWVGITLGKASNAMYLREPINHTHSTAGGRVVFKIDPDNPPDTYTQAGDNAFRGIPAFPDNVVVMPDQWSVLSRNKRHVVVKEVNPYACDWFIERYQPRIILLVRHPAGVAQSFKRLDWWPSTPEDEFYQRQGNFQGEALAYAVSSLNNYPHKKIMLYEDLCTKPVEKFHELFEFAGLLMESKMEQYIINTTSGGDRSVHWYTDRNSLQMVDIWKEEILSKDLHNLLSTYHQYDLPFYHTIDD